MTSSPSRSDPALKAVFDLAEYLVSGQHVPADSRELLRQALHDSITSGFEVSLYAALGLKTWGGTSALRKVGLSRRDRVLCRLRRKLPEWAQLSAAAAAKAMSASARRYETDRWPREQHNIAGPATEPFSTWWSFLRAGIAVPGERQLSTILKMEIQDGFEFRGRPVILDAKGAQR
ncbi:hypothetical protein ACCS33_10725 [Rhizobium ruizarguesonis]|nr:hypothetical protein [Rhizobium leguminosarum bv. viciae]